jgi:hypothetical protein
MHRPSIPLSPNGYRGMAIIRLSGTGLGIFQRVEEKIESCQKRIKPRWIPINGLFLGS